MRIVARENFLGALSGPLDHVGRALLEPLLGTGAVGDIGIDVVLLHELEGLRVTEEVTGPLDADLAYRLDREIVVGHLDAAHRAHDRAQHVVVDDAALEAEAEQAGVHAGRLVDQVAAGLGRERHGVAFLETGLGVGHFGIGHAGGHGARQIVEMGHLGAGRAEDRLLAAAPAHGAGAQVRDEGPGAEQAGVPG